MNTNNTHARITFHGGVGEVTGANFLIEYNDKKILVDCGMFQGSEEVETMNHDDFPYNPADIDVLIVTHAHQDHIGRIPKLVHDGFNGTIISTLPTRDLTEVMLEDAAGIIEYEAKKNNTEPLYTHDDIPPAMKLWKTLPYHNLFTVVEGVSCFFHDAGHVLGSAMAELRIGSQKILFTGDLGNSPSPLLHDLELVEGMDYIIMESVYGDRNHSGKEDRSQELASIINDTINKKGTLMIPVFSLERTQEILFELYQLTQDKHIPELPIFLDSPLAQKVTEIYQKHIEFFKKDVRSLMNHGEHIFDMKNIRITRTKEDSKEINDVPAPKIILAGAGMMSGGRILHHAMQYIEDPNATLLFVGYQAPGTTGGLISNGAKKVRIYHNDFSVKARIESIPAYSGHAGSDELVQFVEASKTTLKKVFCVMGETSSSLFLAQRLRDYLGVYAIAPEPGDSVDIDIT